MKAPSTLGAAVLFLSLGSTIPAFAQNEEAKPEQHAQTQEQHAQPQQHAQPRAQAKQENQGKQEQQHAQHQNQNKQQQQQAKQESQNVQHQQQQAKDNQNVQEQHQAKQESQNVQHQQQNHNEHQQQAQHTQEQRHVQQAAWQGHRSQNWQSNHRTWQQRGGYHGYRIPDNRYNGYFGPGHGFVIFSQPYMVVGGLPRFQYGGYWFSVVDPWPSNWSNNWYETDDVYVVYANNGYYMYNQSYPGVGIAISVSL